VETEEDTEVDEAVVATTHSNSSSTTKLEVVPTTNSRTSRATATTRVVTREAAAAEGECRAAGASMDLTPTEPLATVAAAEEAEAVASSEAEAGIATSRGEHFLRLSAFKLTLRFLRNSLENSNSFVKRKFAMNVLPVVFCEILKWLSYILQFLQLTLFIWHSRM